MRKQLTQEQLHHLLIYDPETGYFMHRADTYRCRSKAGSRAGAASGHGYRKITIAERSYYEHRLAVLYMTGEWPKEVDHINRDGLDNRWANLRLATRSQNVANAGPHKDNTAGYRGVKFRAGLAKPYIARIMVDGKERHIGYFATAEEAHAAYVAAARESFGVYASAG